jgi:hypothetical protein
MVVKRDKTFIEEKTTPIIDILRRVVASGFIKNASPISALIVAPVGAGKTTALKKISVNKNILALSDVTPYGLTMLLNEIKDKKITHIIIFDLVQPMSRSRSVVNSLIGFLNSLIEEGIFRISTGVMQVKEPIKLGLISCTTEKEIQDKRRGWLGIGFISRLIPISFAYTKTDVIQILEDLAEQKISDISYEKLKAKSREIKENPQIFKLLIPYAEQMAINEALPFRNQNQLQILLMANALLRGGNKVEKEDFEWFKSISKYLNYNLNQL